MVVERRSRRRRRPERSGGGDGEGLLAIAGLVWGILSKRGKGWRLFVGRKEM